MAGNGLVAKVLREKYVYKEVKRTVGNKEDLNELWNTMYACYEA
jgi:hypothetical protein